VISLDAVGRASPPASFRWTADDTILYALGVGAGQDDPAAELRFTTENSAGVELTAIPTMLISLVQRYAPKPDYGDIPPSCIVHGEQHLTLHRPLPASGAATVTTTISGIYDHGKSAVAHVDGEVRATGDGTLIGTTRLIAFLRGQGGFGGDRDRDQAPAGAERRPDAPADLGLRLTVRPEQALLYRLSGDRNRLHSDPVFAREGGFGRPILHGLCTLGMAVRRLIENVGGGQPAQFRSVFARFSKPVHTGTDLRLEVWTGAEARFRVLDAGGAVVLDRGRFTWQ
jgi:acyl dehydratase